ncbi:MAG: acyl carrier protein [Pseudoalteromonas tetraodonis]|jgi:acyl carrier protein
MMSRFLVPAFLVTLFICGCERGKDISLQTRKDVVVEIVAEQFGRAPHDIADSDLIFGSELQGDQLDLVELVMALEERFGIEIQDEALAEDSRAEYWKMPLELSVGDLVDIVEE